MTLARSVMIRSPQELASQVQTRNHAWCRPAYGPDQPCEWGTVIMDDPAGHGYDLPYRDGGADVGHLIVVRSIGPPTRNAESCNSSSPWYPFCDEMIYQIRVVKSATRTPTGDFSYLDEGSYNFFEDVFCTEGGFVLYQDKSLTGVCNPGGHFVLRTQEDQTTGAQIYKPLDSYSIEGAQVATTVTSGDTRLEFTPNWQYVASGVGFYENTDFMEVGGFLTLGPNTGGDSVTVTITNIVSETEVDTTEIRQDFAVGDNIDYWTSEVQKSNPFHVTQGIEPDPAGEGEGEKVTEFMLESKGGLDASTVVESFIPVPWAIPAPYSIRNVPHTNIWLRLDEPGLPFNTSTLRFKVNNEDVTEDVDVTLVTGGIELLYDPPVNFDMSSRVYVDIEISCSPSRYRYLSENAPVGSEFITVSGDISGFQPYGLLKLGPNLGGAWEMAGIRYIDGNVIKLEDITEYEYVSGDLVTYTHDDYPVEISYYFDIVDDFKPPYFENIYPYNGMENVSRSHWIMFDVKDEGLGVDISTLTFTVDNMVVIPDIYKFHDNWYRVIYSPPVPYYYNTVVSCFATVQDNSIRKNRAYAVWSFSTEAGELPFIVNPKPYFCAYPVHHKSHIELDLFARGAGANLQSMIFTWDQKEYKVITYPKVYRWS